jgi:hypothetical protein
MAGDGSCQINYPEKASEPDSYTQTFDINIDNSGNVIPNSYYDGGIQHNHHPGSVRQQPESLRRSRRVASRDSDLLRAISQRQSGLRLHAPP